MFLYTVFVVLILVCFRYLQDAPEVPVRESWMTELPPELQHIGLGARTFKKKSGPENKDRSIWTDTPADRERKSRVKCFGFFFPFFSQIFRHISIIPFILL